MKNERKTEIEVWAAVKYTMLFSEHALTPRSSWQCSLNQLWTATEISTVK